MDDGQVKELARWALVCHFVLYLSFVAWGLAFGDRLLAIAGVVVAAMSAAFCNRVPAPSAWRPRGEN